MIVRITHSNGRIPKVGELYETEYYPYDTSKVTLLYMVDEDTHEKSEIQHWEDPCYNHYLDSLDIIS